MPFSLWPLSSFQIGARWSTKCVRLAKKSGGIPYNFVRAMGAYADILLRTRWPQTCLRPSLVQEISYEPAAGHGPRRPLGARDRSGQDRLVHLRVIPFDRDIERDLALDDRDVLKRGRTVHLLLADIQVLVGERDPSADDWQLLVRQPAARELDKAAKLTAHRDRAPVLVLVLPRPAAYVVDQLEVTAHEVPPGSDRSIVRQRQRQGNRLAVQVQLADVGRRITLFTGDVLAQRQPSDVGLVCLQRDEDVRVHSIHGAGNGVVSEGRIEQPAETVLKAGLDFHAP